MYRLGIALTIAAALSLGPVFAQSQGGQKEMKFSGTVQSVDPATMKMSVMDKKGMAREFTATSATEVQKSGQTMKMSDIKAGDKVTVHYTGTIDNPTVTRVMVTGGKGAQGGTKKGKGAQGGGSMQDPQSGQ